MKKRVSVLRLLGLVILLSLVQFRVLADDSKDFPPRPNPPRLVNDLANCMTTDQQAQLEAKLERYNDSSSTEIAIVTIKSLGDYDISDYALKLGNIWGVGKKGKYNGVMVLASINDRKINISPAKGLEGALPDAICAQIIRHEIVPAFKQGDYYDGFSSAADAIIAATKGEYKADGKDNGKGITPGIVVGIIVLIYIILWIISRIGGGGGGTYMSGRGYRGFGGGWIGGGFGGFGGGSSSGGSGFGGFGGGGGFSGGGSSGSW
ncbi:MAG: TPM domain-containing protein [Flavipsychrobacter sp.]